MVHPEDGRILQLLEKLLAMKKISVRELERRVGVPEGVFRRLFAGRTVLRFRHITQILEVLEIPPKSFFALAYELEDSKSDKSETLLSQILRISSGPEKLPPTPVTRKEVQAMIAEALKQLEVTWGRNSETQDLDEDHD